MTSLYDLSGIRCELIEALLRVADEEGEPADHAEREANLAAVLSGIDADIADKADDIAWVVRDLEAQAAAHKAIADEFAMKRRVAENAARRLKGYALACMDRAGLEKVKGEQYTLALQASPPSIAEMDERAAVEAGFGEMVPKVDSRAVIATWKTNPQQVTFAVVTQGKHLRIR